VRLARYALLFLSTLAACKKPSGDSGPVGEATVATRAPEPTPSASAPASAVAYVPAASLKARAQREIYFGIYTKTQAPPPLQAAKIAEVKKRFPALAFVTEAAPGKSTVTALFPPIEQLPAPDAERLAHLGRGLDDAGIKAIAASKGVAMFAWDLEADPKYEVLRSASAFLREMAAADRGFLWDDSSAEMFAIDAWKQRESSWEGDIPDAHQFFNIHYYETEGRHRAVSLGLVKLGVPDFVLEDVPRLHATMGMMLINACAQLMVEGAGSDASGRFTVDLAAIKHKGMRHRLQQETASGATMRGDVVFAMATHRAGDPETPLVELRFEGFPEQTPGERQAAALRQIFGAGEDTAVPFEAGNPELEAVKKTAQEKVPVLAAAIQKGLPVGESMMVKGPFATDDGSTEWMWVEVASWKNGVVNGTLANQPLAIKKLKLGAKVDVRQELISDYLWSKADGSEEGGGSTQVLKKLR
jgi:uncharacterized protein YegJ (DUF2314 family)